MEQSVGFLDRYLQIHRFAESYLILVSILGNCMESEGIVPLNNKVFDPKMTNHTIDVYYFPLSPPSRATLLLIRALGIKHNMKIVNIQNGEQLSPDFLKMNPLHTVPVINDGGFILYDSHVIMKYLVEQYAKDDSLYPKDPKKGAIVNLRLFFNATYLTPRFVDYIVKPMFSGVPGNDESRTRLEEALQHMDNFLKNQDWVAGTNMTIADFSLITIFSSIDVCGLFDLTTYQNLWRWYQTTKQAMESFGYEEVNQTGADALGGAYKAKFK